MWPKERLKLWDADERRRTLILFLFGDRIMEYKHSPITDKIIKAFYAVYSNLGYGFLEKVYENCMIIELKLLGLRVGQQVPITVHYRG